MPMPITPEFSRVVDLDRVGSTNLEYTIEATAAECKALAERFDLISIEYAKAEFVISKAQEPGSFRIDGELRAKVDQKCIISLEPVPASLTVPIHVILRPVAEMPQGEETLLELIEEPDIEYYQEYVVDLGEISAQYLYISLEPYPRAPNAKGVTATSLKEEDEAKPNPFEVLKELKKK